MLASLAVCLCKLFHDSALVVLYKPVHNILLVLNLDAFRTKYSLFLAIVLNFATIILSDYILS